MLNTKRIIFWILDFKRTSEFFAKNKKHLCQSKKHFCDLLNYYFE